MQIVSLFFLFLHIQEPENAFRCKLHKAKAQKECKPMAATTISPAIRKQMSSVAVAMKVAVIGSGISGAVCASTLARNGVSVTIFDSGRGPGGRMSQRRFLLIKNVPFHL
jgi:ribulose 1,5-bisphosphate synthetase/thiazole synthase